MDISKYREDFPVLNTEDAPTYLDSACMTLRPQQVIDSIVEYYTKYPACGGRSVHRMSWQVTEGLKKWPETASAGSWEPNKHRR